MIGLITCSVMASRRSVLETFSLCCVETTTQETRSGRPLRYSMVTCDFPSGRRKLTLLALRISARALREAVGELDGHGH